MQEISKSAYRYSSIIYILIALYFGYFFYSFWLFLGKNYFPQDISSVFSLQNSRFETLNYILSISFSFLATFAFFLNKKLRHFFWDVGDELSKVSWPTFKEAQKSTFIVIGVVIFVGLFLFLFDSIFIRLINAFMLSAN